MAVVATAIMEMDCKSVRRTEASVFPATVEYNAGEQDHLLCLEMAIVPTLRFIRVMRRDVRQSDIDFVLKERLSMDLICGICMEELGSEKDVCYLPCGHVKHVDCLTKWCEEQKNCPNCWQRFQPAIAFRKRLYFDRDPNSDNQTGGEKNENEKNDSAPATNDALKQQLDESKAEVDASQTRVKNLEESIRELEKKIQDYEAEKQQLTTELHTLEGKNRETQTRVKGLEETNSQLVEKFRNSEDQRQEISERNRQLTAELQTSEGKNQATLERNRELEQELSNSRAKIRDFEAKFEQTDVGQLVTFLEKKSESLKKCEVSRLQDSVETKNNEIIRQNLLLESQNNKITLLRHSLETKNIELQIEQKLRCDIAEHLGKKNDEAAKLSDENTKVKRDLCDIQKKLSASEKQIFDITKDNAKLKHDLLHCQNGLVAAEKRNIDTILEKVNMEEQLTNLSNENAKVKRDLSDIQTRLTASAKQNLEIIQDYAKVKKEFWDIQKRLETAEKQNVERKKEKEKMNEQLAEWQRYHRTISEVAKFGDGIGKEDQDPAPSQGLQQQSPPRLITIVPRAVWKRRNQESGSDGEPAKRARIDTQKKPEESGAKNATNTASGSKAVVI
ncbi:ring finger domain-containing protein [Ditylenchus destructor]|uniref:Ring finger domain-containing protein n=1 Tax=Ditylenchus destructor TaxID=166010 RepID=A0AAD4QVB0_9BILA|nr:ring finger domain-containing protein [Ditylenchus destructor]